tara:strand:+ start:135 stop:539 length:405 start_codon:yes stop_codon:yes gene_type:complete
MKIQFDQIQLPSNRKFGFFFSIIFFIISTYLYYIRIDIFTVYTLYIISFSLFIITLVKADILGPLNKLWMGFGMLLGLIISPIIMGVIFFLVFTPLALVFRIIGRDELILRLKDKPSYWIKRNNNYSNSFRNQF